MVKDRIVKKKSIIILTTGGTIEKSYSEFDGELKNRNSLLKNRLLSRLRLPHTDVELEEIMAKDSLHMTTDDREKICQVVMQKLSLKKPILILHGTDTMDQTGKYLFENIQNLEVPVVLTGAMKPMGFEDSDATQNLVEAMTACQLAKPGVYISFHNHLFKVPNVRKNRQRRTFETLDEA